MLLAPVLMAPAKFKVIRTERRKGHENWIPGSWVIFSAADLNEQNQRSDSIPFPSPAGAPLWLNSPSTRRAQELIKDFLLDQYPGADSKGRTGAEHKECVWNKRAAASRPASQKELPLGLGLVCSLTSLGHCLWCFPSTLKPRVNFHIQKCPGLVNNLYMYPSLPQLFTLFI